MNRATHVSNIKRYEKETTELLQRLQNAIATVKAMLSYTRNTEQIKSINNRMEKAALAYLRATNFLDTIPREIVRNPRIAALYELKQMAECMSSMRETIHELHGVIYCLEEEINRTRFS